MNAIARRLGFRFFERSPSGRWELRLSWAEISGGLGLALGLCSFEDHYSLHIRLGWPNIFIKLPLPERWHREPESGMESWGFSVCTDSWSSVHFNWGDRCAIVHMPWAWTWVRTSHLAADGSTWVHDLKDGARPMVGANRERSDRFGTFRGVEKWSTVLPYRYVLRSGEVQNVEATVTVEEREWRWRWFTALPFPRLIRRTIDVNFSGEIGERAGSWKGGTIGCGYDLRRDETPAECLRRMQAERKF